MFKKVIYTSLLFILISFTGLILYYVINPKKVISLVLPELNRINYIKADLKNDSAFIKASVIVQNKCFYKLTIDTIYFKVKLNGVNVSEEKIAVMLRQSRFDIDTIELPINIPIKKNRALIKNIQDQDSTDAELVCYVIYNTLIGRMKLPYQKKIKIASLKLPQLKILDLEKGKYHNSEKTLDAVVKIEIINKGKNINIELNDIKYDLQIINTFSSKGTVPGKISIKPASDLIHKIPIIMNFVHPLKTVWLVAWDKDKSAYKLNLRTNVKVNNINGINIIPVEVNSVGNMELVK